MMNLKREDLESVVNEGGLTDENGNYSLLEILITTLTMTVMLAANDPAVAAVLNSATVDYLMLVYGLTTPLNLDADLGEVRLRPVETPTPPTPPKPVEVINVQSQQ